MSQLCTHGAVYIVHIARQVFKRALQLKALDDAQHGLAQGVARRIVGAIGRPGSRFVIFDVLGTHRRAYENEIVLKMCPVQDPACDRIEEGLAEFGLVMVHQQANVMQLDLLPDVHWLLCSLKLILQSHHAFLHACVIELDAFALGSLLAMPICRLKTVLGARRFRAKQAVMPIKTIHHGLGNLKGNG